MYSIRAYRRSNGEYVVMKNNVKEQHHRVPVDALTLMRCAAASTSVGGRRDAMM